MVRIDLEGFSGGADVSGDSEEREEGTEAL